MSGVHHFPTSCSCNVGQHAKQGTSIATFTLGGGWPTLVALSQLPCRARGSERAFTGDLMKNWYRPFLYVFFTVALSLSSFASSLLCSAGPTSNLTYSSWTVIYTCTVPANAVALNKAIRLTAGFDQSKAGYGGVQINLNGVSGLNYCGGIPFLSGNVYQMTVMNIGSTQGEVLQTCQESSGFVSSSGVVNGL
jgi:hypothetical protein